jgi:hypothetical protein
MALKHMFYRLTMEQALWITDTKFHDTAVPMG